MTDTWSKDFVEHLRTVHFALVTVCVTLVIIVSSTKRFEYSAAIRQVEELQQVDETAVKDAFRYISLHSFTTRPDVGLTQDAESKQPSDNGAPRDEEQQNPNEFDGHIRRFKPCKFKNPCHQVADIERLQVRVGGLELALFIADRADLFRTASNNVIWKEYTFTRPAGVRKFWKSFQDRVTLRRIATLAPASGNINEKPAQIDWVHDPKDGAPRVPLSVDISGAGLYRLHGSIVVNSQKIDLVFDSDVWNEAIGISLFPANDQVPFRNSTFDERFPDAARFMRDRDWESVSFDDFIKDLRSARDKFDNPATVFGFLVPAEQVTPWGLALLVGVQLYFWIHLYEITTKMQSDSPGWGVAWVGVYDREPAKSLCKLSACIAPTITAITLVVLEIWRYSNSISNIEGVVLALSMAGIFWLAFLTYRQINELHKKRKETSVPDNAATIRDEV
jgi:hypothetical protein